MTAKGRSDNTPKQAGMPYWSSSIDILDNLLEGFQVIGFDWKYLYVNDAVAKQGRHCRKQLLGRIMMDGPMARHTLGPVEVFFEHLFAIYEQFGADAIWMAAHIGCKNTRALLGMMRELCRRRRIPLLCIDYDLADARVVSVAEIQDQVTQFMEAVMGHEGARA